MLVAQLCLQILRNQMLCCLHYTKPLCSPVQVLEGNASGIQERHSVALRMAAAGGICSRPNQAYSMTPDCRLL
jgi:hypothetical protein